MFLEDKAKFAGAANAEPAPFTLESLIAWLRTKDADGEYDYHCTQGECLLGLYAADHGFRHLSFIDQYNRFNRACGTGNAAMLVTAMFPHTFDAALARAEKLLASGTTPLPSNEAKRSSSL